MKWGRQNFFQHDIAYGDFKDLTWRATFDKVLRDKAFDLAKNLKYDGQQRELAPVVYKTWKLVLLHVQANHY